MKKQPYLLSIKNPCEQDWSLMTQNDIGKYCSQCSKTVIDFTALSDKEIFEIMNQASGKVCGRLTKQQLNRPIAYKQQTNFARFYNILAGLILLGTTGNSFANKSNTPSKEIIENNQLTLFSENANVGLSTDSLKNIVRGKVVDKDTKMPIPGAIIGIKGSNKGINTDGEGQFKLLIPDAVLADNITLITMAIGYKGTETTVNMRDLSISQDLVVIPIETDLLGEVVVVGSIVAKQKKWWQFWKK